jgi:hypothetical protein
MNHLNLAWSDWQKLGSDNVAPDVLGVYEVRAVKDGSPLVIQRARQPDTEGLLYIGSAKPSLKARVGALCGGRNNPKLVSHHDIGKLYKDYEPQMLQVFGSYDDFEVRWAKVPEGQAPRCVERQLGDKYSAEFLDLPPFNLKPPGS